MVHIQIFNISNYLLQPASSAMLGHLCPASNEIGSSVAYIPSSSSFASCFISTDSSFLRWVSELKHVKKNGVSRLHVLLKYKIKASGYHSRYLLTHWALLMLSLLEWNLLKLWGIIDKDLEDSIYQISYLSLIMWHFMETYEKNLLIVALCDVVLAMCLTMTLF